MNIKIIIKRLGFVCSIVAISGCSLLDNISRHDRTSSYSPPSAQVNNHCRWNPESCIWKGSYENGERDYAEAEAQRLNRASLERLRRMNR